MLTSTRVYDMWVKHVNLCKDSTPLTKVQISTGTVSRETLKSIINRCNMQ